MERNIFIKGDNLAGLHYLLEEKGLRGKIDLVYIDPPFATRGTFTMTDGRATTVSRAKTGSLAYADTIVGKDFVEELRRRLVLIYELLSDRGSIYLHTDYKIGHYVKVMMDEVFGIEHFRNDITRIKCNPKNFQRIGYGNIKDMLLFYTKGDTPIWHEPKEDYTAQDIARLFPKTDKEGRRYTTVPLHAPGESDTAKPFQGLLPPQGRHWRTDVALMEQWDREGLIEWSSSGNPRKIIYADEKEGKRIQDIWTFKDPPYPSYPTEKNADLLDLIVRTSSEVGSIVLDCFCGSGTTLLAAKRHRRQWIGIDRSDMAFDIVKKKLHIEPSDLFDEVEVVVL